MSGTENPLKGKDTKYVFIQPLCQGQYVTQGQLLSGIEFSFFYNSYHAKSKKPTSL